MNKYKYTWLWRQKFYRRHQSINRSIEENQLLMMSSSHHPKVFDFVSYLKKELSPCWWCLLWNWSTYQLVFSSLSCGCINPIYAIAAMLLSGVTTQCYYYYSDVNDQVILILPRRQYCDILNYVITSTAKSKS